MRRFIQLMRDNVGLVAIHWATGVGYNKLADSEALLAEFKNSLGGWFRRPPCDVSMGQALLQKPNGEHPIYRGWKAWEIRDEFYLNPVLHKKAKPLLEVTVEGKTHVVGWTFNRLNAGRSVGITLGHFHHNFAREDFRRVLVNSILWSAKQPIPDTGSDVSVKDVDLTLLREKVKSFPNE